MNSQDCDIVASGEVNMDKLSKKERKAVYAKKWYEKSKHAVQSKQKEYRVNNKEQLREAAKRYREENKDKESLQKKEYYQKNREKLLLNKKRYKEANREKIAAKDREYYENNKQKIFEYKRTYRKANKEKERIINRKSKQRNKERVATYAKKYYEKNKEKSSTYAKERRSVDREKSSTYAKKYYEKHLLQKKEYKKANKEKIAQNSRLKYKTDIQYKIRVVIRTRLKQTLKTYIKYGKYVKISSAIKELGCTVEELKLHLESRFQEGMTWDNHGLHGWHIDHIKPLASFDLTDIEQFKQACHYSNLQPLWATDNLSKGAKIIDKKQSLEHTANTNQSPQTEDIGITYTQAPKDPNGVEMNDC